MEVFKEKELREYGIIPKRISRSSVKNSIKKFLIHYKENNVYKHSLFKRIFKHNDCQILEEEINTVLEQFSTGLINDQYMNSILNFTCINDIRKVMDTHVDMLSEVIRRKYTNHHDSIIKELLLFRDYLLTKMIRSYKIIQ